MKRTVESRETIEQSIKKSTRDKATIVVGGERNVRWGARALFSYARITGTRAVLGPF